MFEQIRINFVEQAGLFFRQSWNVSPNHLFACWRECRDNLMSIAIRRWINENRDRVVAEVVRTATTQNSIQSNEIAPDTNAYEIIDIVLELGNADYDLCEHLGLLNMAGIIRSVSTYKDVIWRIQVQDNSLTLTENRPLEQFIVRQTVAGEIIAIHEPQLMQQIPTMTRGSALPVENFVSFDSFDHQTYRRIEIAPNNEGPTDMSGETGVQGISMLGETSMGFSPINMLSETGMGFVTETNVQEELSHFPIPNITVKEAPIPEKLRCDICKGEKADEQGKICQTCKDTGLKNIKMKWLNE